MADVKKVLDQEGLKYLWSRISMEDYPNNSTLMAVIDAIDETKVDKIDGKDLSTNDFTDEYIQIITGNVANVQSHGNRILTIEQALNGVGDAPGLIAKVNNLVVAVQANADTLAEHGITIGNLSSTVLE
jgi:hypothetical protein